MPRSILSNPSIICIGSVIRYRSSGLRGGWCVWKDRRTRASSAPSSATLDIATRAIRAPSLVSRGWYLLKEHLFVPILLKCSSFLALGSLLLNPWAVLLVDQSTSQPLDLSITSKIEVDLTPHYISHEWLDVFLENAHVSLEHRTGLSAHGEILVEVAEVHMVEICWPAQGELPVEVETPIRCFAVVTVADVLREPLAKEVESHPHIDITRVRWTSWFFFYTAVEEVRVVTEDAHLDGFFGKVKFFKLHNAEGADVWTELCFLLFAEHEPSSDDVTNALFEDGLRMTPACELGPGDGILADG